MRYYPQSHWAQCPADTFASSPSNWILISFFAFLFTKDENKDFLNETKRMNEFFLIKFFIAKQHWNIFEKIFLQVSYRHHPTSNVSALSMSILMGGRDSDKNFRSIFYANFLLHKVLFDMAKLESKNIHAVWQCQKKLFLISFQFTKVSFLAAKWTSSRLNSILMKIWKRYFEEQKKWGMERRTE